MARIRTIKPEFFTNSKIMKLTPLARLFYVSLWCEADRMGRLKWDADSLKARYLPSDKTDAEDLGTVLANAKLIRFYEVAGVLYVDIPGFPEHQVINNRESDSKIPPYSDDACVTRESGVKVAACGKEGRNGREGKETPVVPKGTIHQIEFEKFWEAFPNKVGKDAALRAWLKREDRPEIAVILAAVEVYVRTKPSDRDWCNPSTWLNQGRWKDQPAGATSAPQQAPMKRTDDQWRTAAKAYAARKFWPSLYGPEPGYGGCECPPEILAEFGLAPTRNLTMAG